MPALKDKAEMLARAREAAKRLEEQPEPATDPAAVYRDGLEAAEKLKKFLKPVWFVKDEDRPAQKKSPARRAR
jgi:hypothetical protein